ncbi:potassium-transporting ATPase subunit KdpC [Anatilimnocola sp. NA78]|uniref:potassium-transporting ATPase subunit KdpC n=1 Tax=Anatilimnocola sp. NA78 TaxID=3415683 RepID=UPI003CE49E31
MNFLKQTWSALAMLLLLTVLTGVLYPLVVTAVAAVVFPHQAGGSLIVVDRKIQGSALLGQSFSEPKYFWGRLSATGPFPYNAALSSGSNYGPRHPALQAAAEARAAELRKYDPQLKQIPVDLLTSSGSGLDPHISPAAAAVQVARVAKERNISPEAVQQLVAKHTEQRQLGLLGEPRVNVLLLNRDLDAVAAK